MIDLTYHQHHVRYWKQVPFGGLVQSSHAPDLMIPPRTLRHVLPHCDSWAASLSSSLAVSVMQPMMAF